MRTDLVEQATLYYLTVPAVLYCLTFVTAPLGLSIAFLMACYLWIEIRSAISVERTSLSGLWISLPATLLVLWVMGFPEGPFAWDWIKHWALLDLMATSEWPPKLELEEVGQQWLRFYVGAYLVPSGLSRVFQLSLPLTTAVWFGTGVLLIFVGSLQWLRVIPKRRLLLFPLILLLVGGADAIAQIGLRALLGVASPSWYLAHSEWWSSMLIGRPLQYSSILAQLTWVPHQAIASSLSALILLAETKRERITRLPILFGTLALHSPYAAIGLVPLALPLVWSFRTKLLEQCKTVEFLVGSMAGIALGATVLLNLRGELPSGAMLCLNCSANNLPKTIIFLVIELVAIVLCLAREDWRNPIVKAAVWLLVLLPFFGGQLADPVMRISMPALFVLALCATKNILLIETRYPFLNSRGVQYLLPLAIMSATAIGETGFHLTAGSAHKSLPAGDILAGPSYTDFASGSHFTVTEFLDRCGWGYRSQYFTSHRPILQR